MRWAEPRDLVLVGVVGMDPPGACMAGGPSKLGPILGVSWLPGIPPQMHVTQVPRGGVLALTPA